MDTIEMMKRTKPFAIDCGHLILSVTPNAVNHAYSAQLIRSSSSVGAKYRVTRRAKSKTDFINKFKIVEEETDESLFFIELLLNSIKTKETKLLFCIKKAKKYKIIVASLKTLMK